MFGLKGILFYLEAQFKSIVKLSASYDIFPISDLILRDC